LGVCHDIDELIYPNKAEVVERFQEFAECNFEQLCEKHPKPGPVIGDLFGEWDRLAQDRFRNLEHEHYLTEEWYIEMLGEKDEWKKRGDRLAQERLRDLEYLHHLTEEMHTETLGEKDEKIKILSQQIADYNKSTANVSHSGNHGEDIPVLDWTKKCNSCGRNPMRGVVYGRNDSNRKYKLCESCYKTGKTRGRASGFTLMLADNL